jgi:hypothetical protein
MAVKVSDLTTESAPASTDILLIADPTTGLAKKITVSALKTYMDGLGGGGDTTAPVVVTATATTASTIVIVFSESVTVTTAGWSFKKNGIDWGISSVSGSGSTWTFNMSSSGTDSDTILRSYNSGTGVTVDTAANELVTFSDQAVTNEIPAAGAEFVTWSQLTQTTNAGSGTVTGNSGTTPAGATASKKLTKANGNYVEFTIGSTLSDSEALIFALDDSNDASYDWTTVDLIVGVYHFSSAYLETTNGDGEAGTISGAPAASTAAVVRLEIVNTDDVAIKINGSTVNTHTGVLSGITNIYIKAIFAVNSTDKAIESCQGLGLVAI